MRALTEAELQTLFAPPQDTPSQGENPSNCEAGREVYEGPTLQGLESGRRPRLKTVCETCTNSLWLTTPSEVSCYCRVMRLVTWNTSNPRQLTACDGVFLTEEED